MHPDANNITDNVAPGIKVNKQGNNTNFSIPSSSKHPCVSQSGTPKQPNIDKRQASTNNDPTTQGPLYKSRPDHKNRSPHELHDRPRSYQHQYPIPRHLSNSQARRYCKHEKVRASGKHQHSNTSSKLSSDDNSTSSGLRARLREAIHIVKENYAAGVEAAIAESELTKARANAFAREQKGRTQGEKGHTRPTTTRKTKIMEPGKHTLKTKQPGPSTSPIGSYTGAIPLPNQPPFIPKGTISRLCSLCLRDGAVMYAETGRALCEQCRAKAFGAKGGNPQPTISRSKSQGTRNKPSPSEAKYFQDFNPPRRQQSDRRPATDRCTLLPTQEQLASPTWGLAAEEFSSKTIPSRSQTAKVHQEDTSGHIHTKHAPFPAPQGTVLPPLQARSTAPIHPQTHLQSHPANTKPLPPLLIPQNRLLYEPPLLDTPVTYQSPNLPSQHHHQAYGRRPALHIETQINEDYKPASWRKGPGATHAHVNKAPSMKSHRATVASAWDDDEPVTADVLAPPVPSVPSVPAVDAMRSKLSKPSKPMLPGLAAARARVASKTAGPQLPFASLSLRGKKMGAYVNRNGDEDKDGEGDDRQRLLAPPATDHELERQRYSPSVYSDRASSPGLEFGYLAVPEGQWESL